MSGSGLSGRVALDDVQRVAVIIARAIEPGLIVETGHVDDQRVAFPAAVRPSHPGVDRDSAFVFMWIDAAGVRELVGHQESLAVDWTI